MAYTYKFADIVSADVAVQAEADSVEQLFTACATAMFDVMTDIDKIKAKKKLKFSLENRKLDSLLVDFLSELIFLKDTEGMVFCKFDLGIKKAEKGKGKSKKTTYCLDAAVSGEKIDRKKSFRTDVKAVTYHQLYAKQDPKTKKWKAQVVVDI